MLLSIIIINYNTFQLTCNCIRSIKETTQVKHEIILVDNDSKECPPQKFTELFPEIRLIALQENIGFGRANNLAVAAAKGDFVLLLNSDTVVHPNTINETFSYMQQHPDTDVLGCKVIFENHRVQSTVIKDEQQTRLLPALGYLIKRNALFVEIRLFFMNRWSNYWQKKRVRNSHVSATKSLESTSINFHNGKRIGYLVGVFLLVKRKVFIATQGFDPDFFMYYEEIEWFVKRLRKYNIVYYPHVTITHKHGGSDIHNAMTEQSLISQHLFWYKMGYIQYFFYLLYLLAEIPSRFLVRVVFGNSRPSRKIPIILRTLPYFFKVIRHSNKFGSRKEMLKLGYLQKVNH